MNRDHQHWSAGPTDAERSSYAKQRYEAKSQDSGCLPYVVLAFVIIAVSVLSVLWMIRSAQ